MGREKLAYYTLEDELLEDLEEIILTIQAKEEDKTREREGFQIELIYNGRNKLYRLRYKSYDLVVKCFAVPHYLRGVYYSYFGQSKAKRSFQNSLLLESLEVGTAKPRAFVEEKNAMGLLQRSYYIADWIDYTEAHIQEAMRGWTAPQGFLGALAKFIVHLHELGVEHTDLSPGNILYKYDETKKHYDFYLVDVNRMSFYTFPLNERQSLHNMERLASSSSVSGQLATYYAEERGWDIGRTRALLNSYSDAFWLNRLKKLAFRWMKKRQGMTTLDILKVYTKYRWLRLRRKLATGHRAEELKQEAEVLYRQHLCYEDIRFALKRKDGYTYKRI